MEQITAYILSCIDVVLCGSFTAGESELLKYYYLFIRQLCPCPNETGQIPLLFNQLDRIIYLLFGWFQNISFLFTFYMNTAPSMASCHTEFDTHIAFSTCTNIAFLKHENWMSSWYSSAARYNTLSDQMWKLVKYIWRLGFYGYSRWSDRSLCYTLHTKRFFCFDLPIWWNRIQMKHSFSTSPSFAPASNI